MSNGKPEMLKVEPARAVCGAPAGIQAEYQVPAPIQPQLAYVHTAKGPAPPPPTAAGQQPPYYPPPPQQGQHHPHASYGPPPMPGYAPVPPLGAPGYPVPQGGYPVQGPPHLQHHHHHQNPQHPGYTPLMNAPPAPQQTGYTPLANPPPAPPQQPGQMYYAHPGQQPQGLPMQQPHVFPGQPLPVYPGPPPVQGGLYPPPGGVALQQYQQAGLAPPRVGDAPAVAAPTYQPQPRS